MRRRCPLWHEQIAQRIRDEHYDGFRRGPFIGSARPATVSFPSAFPLPRDMHGRR